MNLWIDRKEPAPKSYSCKWLWVTNISNSIDLISRRANDIEPVTMISVQASMADEFCEKLDRIGGTFQVTVHGGEITPLAAKLIMKNHWNKKVMDNRTTEIIMVLKGQHNLAECLPEDLPQIGAYLQDVALYLSDDCMCPFSAYINNPGCMSSVIQNVVTDYIDACENPAFFVSEYFNAKRQWGDRYNDDQCWCVALMMTKVQNNGTYVNGFNAASTKQYQRQRKFIP